MTDARPELASMPRRRLGYYGLRRLMVIHGVPDWAWRVYWVFQPVRCVFGFHNWYSIAAGECSACECGASGAWPTWIAHQYKFTPWLRSWVAKAEDAEYSAQVAWEAFQDHFEKEHAA